MAKLLKLRRGTTTQHGSFTGAEGEVTIDTTKDTAVVHDGSTAGGRALAREDMSNVSSASIAGRLSADSISTDKINAGALPTDVTIVSQNITNGTIVTGDIASDTIVNANINSGAAIAGTKISPDFGAQSIITTGPSASGDVTITSSAPKVAFVDSGENPDFEIKGDGGTLKFRDTTNNADRIIIRGGGTVDIEGNLDANAGLDVTGNITVTGTVDGVDVAALNTTVGNLGVSGGAIASSTTATTQSQGDNSTKVATTAYTDTAISNLVDSSPGALNTLTELAAAINDDANFSTTITNSIATKMPLAGGEFTGAITCEDITPDFDSNRNLGTNSIRFANVYADNFVGSGANLTGVESFVSGMIILWSGAENAIPSGFVLCNGSNSTPDLRDRFVVGAGSSYSVGATGGSANVTLSTSQIPSHAHSGNAHSHSANFGNHTHSFSGSGSSSHTHNMHGGMQYGGSQDAYLASYQSNRQHTDMPNYWYAKSANVSISVSGNTGNASVSGNTSNATANVGNTGGGGAHENRPPYYSLCYIMKT